MGAPSGFLSQVRCPSSRPSLLQSGLGIPTHESEHPWKRIETQSQQPEAWYLDSLYSINTSKWSWSEHGPVSTHAEELAASLVFCWSTPCPAGHQWQRAGGQIFVQPCHWSWGWSRCGIIVRQVNQRYSGKWFNKSKLFFFLINWILLLKLQLLKEMWPLKCFCYLT